MAWGQPGALGLVPNAVVLWPTRHVDAAVGQLRVQGHEIRDAGVARLSPLKHRNLHVSAATASRPPPRPL
ncbi:transposase [Streptomyces sp. NBC_01446]|uniref:Transposase n=1 Tax=Streptomyces sp. NBC_00119 TaxID=2975659 RepID=A0AAU1UL44_9ACTN|nr:MULTISPECIES: Tn3 family transposase [unclassified Streptomyces]MCX4649699.1 transposase [Streptomyces sp. NBC_01446]MCX5321092.1 transposase [Streptomyces sp. NBC_00120]